MRELWARIGKVAASQGYGLATALISLSVTARWLGAEGRGTIATISTWATVIAAGVGLSLGPVALHLATERRQSNWLGPLLGTLLVLCLSITVVAWVGIVVVRVCFRDVGAHLPIQLLALGLLNVPLLIWEQYSNSLLSASGQTGNYNRALLFGRTTTLLLTLAAWAMNLGMPAVLAGVVVGQGVLVTTALCSLLSSAKGKLTFDRQTCWELLRGSVNLHPAFVGAILVTSSAVLVISEHLGSTETGFYQLAVQLLALFGFIPQAAALVTSGRVAAEGPDLAWGKQRKIVGGVLLVIAATAALAALLAPWVIPFVVGSNFSQTIPVFRVLLLSLPGVAAGTLIAPQWIGRGKFGTLSVTTLVLGLSNLAALLIVVPRTGVIGAAWTTVGVYTAAFAVHARMAWQCEARWRIAVMTRPLTTQL